MSSGPNDSCAANLERADFDELREAGLLLLAATLFVTSLVGSDAAVQD